MESQVWDDFGGIFRILCTSAPLKSPICSRFGEAGSLRGNGMGHEPFGRVVLANS